MGPLLSRPTDALAAGIAGGAQLTSAINQARSLVLSQQRANTARNQQALENGIRLGQAIQKREKDEFERQQILDKIERQKEQQIFKNELDLRKLSNDQARIGLSGGRLGLSQAKFGASQAEKLSKQQARDRAFSGFGSSPLPSRSSGQSSNVTPFQNTPFEGGPSDFVPQNTNSLPEGEPFFGDASLLPPIGDGADNQFNVPQSPVSDQVARLQRERDEAQELADQMFKESRFDQSLLSQSRKFERRAENLDKQIQELTPSEFDIRAQDIKIRDQDIRSRSQNIRDRELTQRESELDNPRPTKDQLKQEQDSLRLSQIQQRKNEILSDVNSTRLPGEEISPELADQFGEAGLRKSITENIEGSSSSQNEKARSLGQLKEFSDLVKEEKKIKSSNPAIVPDSPAKEQVNSFQANNPFFPGS